MKDRDERGSNHNGFCILFWELEIYPDDAKEGSRKCNQENGMIKFLF